MIRSSTVQYDLSSDYLFYHGTASNNWTANFINVPTTNNKSITTNIFINQGPTIYEPNVIQINGVTQTLIYGNGTYSFKENTLNVIGLVFLRVDNDWQSILTQINYFE